MGFMLRFTAIYIFKSGRISLGSSCLLRNYHSALTRPNAMEGFVVVSYAKQLHLITPNARSKGLQRGVGNALPQSQGQRGFILTVELYITMVSTIP